MITKIANLILSVIFWIAILAMLALIFVAASGCATARATESSTFLTGEPHVQVEVVSLDPSITFDYAVPTETGDVVVTMQGQATLRYRIWPPGWPVTIEQSPDLKNWVEALPLADPVLIQAGGDSELYEATYQVLTNPDSDGGEPSRKQFFRAQY